MIYVHIFHNDLSLRDNRVIMSTLDAHKGKITEVCFLVFLNEDQLLPNANNKNYFSPFASLFFIDALINLDSEIRLLTKNRSGLTWIDGITGSSSSSSTNNTTGNSLSPDFLKKVGFVSYNKLFSAYSRRRDEELVKLFTKHNPSVTIIEDWDFYTVVPTSIEHIPYYKVFSAFYKHFSMTYAVQQPVEFACDRALLTHANHVNHVNRVKQTKTLEDKYAEIVRALLPQYANVKEYETTFKISATTTEVQRRIALFKKSKSPLGSCLSRYIALGIGGSIRWYYTSLPKKKEFRKQLFWRSFYVHLQRNSLALGTLHSTALYKELDPRYSRIKWTNDDLLAKKLWLGQSGYPYLDAHVRMCIRTGFMQNMARLNVMCVAIKILCFDPYATDKKWCGNNAFSRILADTFGSSQMLNILWVLGLLDTGFSRFNPAGTIRGRVFKFAITPKHVSESLGVIREFVPELANASDVEVCKWHTLAVSLRNQLAPEYPDLAFNYEKQLIKWKQATTI
jgi:deoxyribodipyrimidine photolyase